MGVKVDFTPGGNPVKHGGSGTAYANYKCRCDECTEANTARTKRRRNARYGEAPPEDIHGKYSTYSNWGCRCELCLAAGAQHNSENYISRKNRLEELTPVTEDE